MASLYRDLISLTEEFEQTVLVEEVNIKNFSAWLFNKLNENKTEEFEIPDWEGKNNGRSAESVINTSLVHLYKYAKVYSKIAIADSPFSTMEDVIFLINLLHFGSMTKMQLIELNVQEKSTGIQVINRLHKLNFISETVDIKDKRSKQISITKLGEKVLFDHMDKIREASRIVVGNLNANEKFRLILLLQKLEDFHKIRVKDII